MNKNHYTILDSAASLHIPDDLDLFPQVKARLNQRRTFMQTLRARPTLAILLAVLALLLLTGVVYAISRSLGYIPGIGIVEQGAKLRVLAEPVSQTREGVTVTIEQAIVDSQRTVVVYKAEGLSLQAANSKGEGAVGHYVNSLRLPDRTLLEESPSTGYEGTPEPLINTVQAENGWPNYVRRLVYPPIDSQINELTLVLPGLENMPAGTAPENWEIPFHLKPAPPDMTFVPILELTSQVEPVTTNVPSAEATNAVALSNTSTRNGFTLSLTNVIEVDNGFVFTGDLSWTDSAFPSAKGISVDRALPALSDGNGQGIPVEEVQLNAPYEGHKMPWSIRTNRKALSGPLVFSIPSIRASYETPATEFDLDLGPSPQIGQTWELNRDFLVEGHTIRLLLAQLINPPDTCSQAGLEFRFKTDLADVGVSVADMNPEPTPDQVCSGGGGGGGIPVDPTVTDTALSYRNIPSGSHRFSLIARIPYIISGPWQVTWNPPLSSEPTPTAQPETCLMLDKWSQLIGQNDTRPAGAGGKVIVTIDEGGNLPAIYVNSLDGMHSQKIDEGAWPSFSKDGTRLTYSAANGLRVLDLASGQSVTFDTNGYNVIWSPDNTRMMYTDTFHLYIVNADGSGLQTVDTGSAQVIAPVGWLSDNQTILYSAMGGEGFNVKSHNLQTGETKDLFIIHNKAGFASVSPDGQWIVFADREFGAQGWAIFISRVDGSDRRRVADTDVPTGFASFWGPDGQWLILNTYGPGEKEIPILVNPFTCQALHVNTIHGMVGGWGP